MARRKLRAARKQIERDRAATIHDRRAQQLPVNAMVRVLTVDDPYEIGSLIQVMASLRDDPLGRLHSHRQIDEAQYRAGRHWQQLLEESEIGGVKAMDTTKEPVDGGHMAETLTDRHRRAVLQLSKVRKRLGAEGEALVQDVLGRRIFIEQIARARYISTQRGVDYLGRRFRECLETMAHLFGYA